MNEKYELADETVKVGGKTLYRIRALREIRNPSCRVAAGDLGGYVESEANLDPSDEAWVCGQAVVYAQAVVRDVAWVCGQAVVRGQAVLYGGIWEKSPLYIQGTRYPAYICTPDKFAIGCQHYTFAGWNRFWKRIAKKYAFTEEVREYIAYFNLACDRYGKQEYKILDLEATGNGEVDDEEENDADTPDQT